MNARLADFLTIFFLAVALIFSSLDAKADTWDTTDKVLGVTALTLEVMDWGQTREIAKNPKQWYEKGHFLPEHPSVAEVNKHFISSIIMATLIADALPSPYRKAWLASAIVFEFRSVRNNHLLGIKMSF